MIVTLIDAKINIISDDFNVSFSADILDKLKSNSLLRRESAVCKFFANGKEKQLYCPILKTQSNGNVVLCPSIKIPSRKYPVYVYLYAVALYLSSKMSMRDVASKVRKKFGLPSFSHSTLSRVLKKLMINADEIEAILILEKASSSSSTTVVERPWWNEQQFLRYCLLYQILYQALDSNMRIDFCSTLSYKFFNRYHKYLI